MGELGTVLLVRAIFVGRTTSLQPKTEEEPSDKGAVQDLVISSLHSLCFILEAPLSDMILTAQLLEIQTEMLFNFIKSF